MSGVYRPGYYGKLPQRGDFIKQGLPSSFINRWDNWLSEGMEYGKTSLDEDWLSQYLHAPVWRFYLSPGVLDKHCCIGVFFPSVDKVGRYFPFTMMCIIPEMPYGWFGNEKVDTYFSRLERIGMVALDEACDIQDMEEALADCAWPYPASLRKSPKMTQWNGPEEERYAFLSNQFFSLLQENHPGLTLWWTSRSAGNIDYMINQNMPEREEFIQFL